MPAGLETSVQLEAFAATARQDGRATNEDAFLIRRGPPFVVALADGAGEAELAARRALRLLDRSISGAAEENFRVFSTWSRWFRAIDAALGGGAESTLVALAAWDGRVLGAAAGDTRAYLWSRDGDLTILNEGADKHRLGSGAADPYPIHVPFEHGATLLLATDGAWTPLPLPRLRALIARFALRPLAELPEAVLHEAARAGQADDMTVLAVRQA